MNIGYLTTKYPVVSHTFIRREIMELERRGHNITRIALRPSDTPVVDPEDLSEEKKTIYCLKLPFHHHIASFFRILLTHPGKFFLALKTTLHMSRLSDRGLPKHIAYLIEAATLLYILKKRGVEHLHVHFGTNITATARLIYLLGGPPYSFTVHGPDELDAPIGFDLPGKIHDSRFVVAISNFCSAQLMRFSAYEDWDKIQIVHCAVRDDFFAEYSPIDPSSKIFLSIGRLSAQKGQKILIEAFKKFHSKNPDAKLIMVGDGEMREEIETKIETEGMQDYIEITGFVSENEVRKYLKSCRSMVLPSFAEGLPMVIMEAFALGRPVISTYIAAIPELVTAENGWLIPAGNIDLLSTAMEENLKSNITDLEKKARNGFEQTQKQHNLITEVDKLEKLIKEYSLKS